jgi:exopolysaccharide biosynthesis polyprenyl glycosylphosphotransferase
MESSVATHREEVAPSPDGRTLLHATPWPQAQSKGRQRGAILARMLLGADVLAALTAAMLGGWIVGLQPVELAIFMSGATIAWPLTAFALGLYNGGSLRFWVSGVSEVPKALTAIVLVSWPLFTLATVSGATAPGAAALWTVLLTALLSPLARASVRAKLHREAPLRQRTVIVGSGVVAGQLVDKMRTHEQYGILPIGLVDDAPHEIGTPDLPRLGDFSHLEQVIREYGVDRVVIAFSQAGHEDLLHCIRVCRDEGVAVDVVPRLFEFLDGVRALDQVGGLPLLSIGTPHLTRTSQVAKRGLDVALSAFLIFLLTPLIVAIVVAIKVESRGPVFFRQPRVGRGREIFGMFKFRSMYADAEDRKHEMQPLNEAGDGVMFKIRSDPRVTRVGRLLRRLSLDELPQLFNVLSGDMSLVGPRPLIPQETAALDGAWQARRLDLRPGMTGPWQIQGRSETPFQEMVRLDYQYVAGWSLARDMEILLATVPAVLAGRGAY